jgi:hypothetical protein
MAICSVLLNVFDVRLPACFYSTWELCVLGDARKENNLDLNGFGAASKEGYIRGVENRSGPFGNDFFYLYFYVIPPQKGAAANQRRNWARWALLFLVLIARS